MTVTLLQPAWNDLMLVTNHRLSGAKYIRSPNQSGVIVPKFIIMPPLALDYAVTKVQQQHYSMPLREISAAENHSRPCSVSSSNCPLLLIPLFTP